MGNIIYAITVTQKTQVGEMWLGVDGVCEGESLRQVRSRICKKWGIPLSQINNITIKRWDR